MKPKHAAEWLAQGWLEGELVLTSDTADEYRQRIGAHIYEQFKQGLWTFDEMERALTCLEVQS
jgi:hypothetical protein